MKKDTFYFSHDYNAATDTKVLFLRQQLGMEGYGIYWYLVEQLAQAGGFLPVKIIPVLAMQMQVTEIKVNAVISKFELFEMFEELFFSVRLNKHLEIRKVLTEKGKEGAIKRWGNREAISPPIGEGNAKKRKGKKKKGNEIKDNIKPESVSLDIWNDFLEIRNKKKAPVTKTVIEMIAKESLKANISLEDAIKYAIFRGWQSFKAEWYLKDNPSKQGTAVKSNAKEII